MILLSIGDRVEEGEYTVHSTFRRVTNYIGARGMVSMADASIEPGPTRIVVRDVRRSNPCSRLRVEQGTLALQGEKVPLVDVSRYDSAIEWPGLPMVDLASNLASFEKALCREAPDRSLAFLLDAERREAFRPGFERVLADHLDMSAGALLQGVREGNLPACREGASAVSGAGFGLTPSGDDFLAGVLVASHVAERVDGRTFADWRACVMEAVTTDNMLSRHFLELARDGRVFKSLRDVVACIGGAEGEMCTCTGRLVAHGATSGADLGVGLLMALRSFLGIERTEGADV
jgi:hypothetical protein